MRRTYALFTIALFYFWRDFSPYFISGGIFVAVILFAVFVL